MRHEVTASLARADDTSEFRSALALCVTELVANAVVHAYGAGRDGDVEVEGSRGNGHVTLCVRDWGEGFSCAEDDDRLGAGLGVVRALASDMSLDCSAGVTQVTARLELA